MSSLSEELTTGYGLLSSVTLSAKILDTWPETEIFFVGRHQKGKWGGEPQQISDVGKGSDLLTYRETKRDDSVINTECIKRTCRKEKTLHESEWTTERTIEIGKISMGHGTTDSEWE